MRRTRAGITVALLVLLAFVAVGCGGDDDDGVVSPAGSSDDAGSVAADFGTVECQRAALAMGQAMSAAGSSAVGGSDFAEGFKNAEEQLEAAKKAAPSEIRDALDTLAAAFADVSDTLEGVDYVPGEGPPPQEWIEAFEVFNDPKYQEASEDVSAWFETGCKD